ncbi:histidine-specific methyltransferase [Cyathus striatus]|nr:histidine-specific methyltransferase [Cyathus striatus]
MPPIRILDIRNSTDAAGSIPDLRAQIIEGLSKETGNKTMPTEVLWDDAGLKIFAEAISTWSERYYPSSAEKRMLQEYGYEIAELIERTRKGGKVVIIELGAGSLEKTARLLECLSQIMEEEYEEAPISYYALDLERDELERTLFQLHDKLGDTIRNKIDTFGMWGTYDDGIRLIENNELHWGPEVPIHLVLLGGTIGNFTKLEGDAAFLKSLPLKSSRGDLLLVGLDKTKPKEAIEYAYKLPVAEEWILNGLKTAGRALTGDEGLFLGEGLWKFHSDYNEESGRFEAGYRCLKTHNMTFNSDKCDSNAEKLNGTVEVIFTENEVVLPTFSNKYTDEEISAMVQKAGKTTVHSWLDKLSQYYILAVQSQS